MLMSYAVWSYQFVDGGGIFLPWISLLDIGHWQREDEAQNVQNARSLHPRYVHQRRETGL